MSKFIRRTGVALICALFVGCLMGSQGVKAQRPDMSGRPYQVSEKEKEAATKIQSATVIDEKLKGAREFMKKYPMSPLRRDIVINISDAIAKVTDPATQKSNMEAFLQIFTENRDKRLMKTLLFDNALRTQDVASAYSLGAEVLQLEPEEIKILIELCMLGADQVRKRNENYIPISIQYGKKAVELVTLDKKPDSISTEQWTQVKTVLLPQVYSSIGLMAFVSQNTADAKLYLGKAIEAFPTFPVNYLFMGALLQGEMKDIATKIEKMPDGPLKEEEKKNLEAKLDEIIVTFAKGIATSDGLEAYKAMNTQLRIDMKAYYNYRHGSTKGMEELILKYKPAPVIPTGVTPN